LEKLWEGTQPLANLKELMLFGSSHFKKLPDLTQATNLERLDLSFCTALVKLPPSIANLRKLVELKMSCCESLEVIPTLINLASIKWFNIYKCTRLRSFPSFPTNITNLDIVDTRVEELSASLSHCSHLTTLSIRGGKNLKTFSTHLPKSVIELHLCNNGCKRLSSLPEIPGSLKWLMAEDCESLESVHLPLKTSNIRLYFTNCFKLGQQARRAIIQQSFVGRYVVLPGREVPEAYDHRSRGSSLTIPHTTFNRFKVCIVISPNYSHQGTKLENSKLLCRCTVIGNSRKSAAKTFRPKTVSGFQAEHLFICLISLPSIDPSEISRKIELHFSSKDRDFDIIECGIQILADNTDGNNSWDFSRLVTYKIRQASVEFVSRKRLRRG
ncbi:hypothetical protein CARUB_v10022473mg, partial [Capsella rubella]